MNLRLPLSEYTFQRLHLRVCISESFQGMHFRVCIFRVCISAGAFQRVHFKMSIIDLFCAENVRATCSDPIFPSKLPLKCQDAVKPAHNQNRSCDFWDRIFFQEVAQCAYTRLPVVLNSETWLSPDQLFTEDVPHLCSANKFTISTTNTERKLSVTDSRIITKRIIILKRIILKRIILKRIILKRIILERIIIVSQSNSREIITFPSTSVSPCYRRGERLGFSCFPSTSVSPKKTAPGERPGF